MTKERAYVDLAVTDFWFQVLTDVPAYGDAFIQEVCSNNGDCTDLGHSSSVRKVLRLDAPLQRNPRRCVKPVSKGWAPNQSVLTLPCGLQMGVKTSHK